MLTATASDAVAEPRAARVMSALPPPAAKREPLAKSLPVEQRLDERRDLGRVGGAVGVEHHDDVAGRGGEAAGERVALAASVLEHDAHVGPQRAGDGDRVVDRVAVDEDDLVDASPGCCASTCGRFAASLRVGITTLIDAVSGFGDSSRRFRAVARYADQSSGRSRSSSRHLRAD